MFKNLTLNLTDNICSCEEFKQTIHFQWKPGFIAIECKLCETVLVLSIEKLDVQLKFDKSNHQIKEEKPTLKIIK